MTDPRPTFNMNDGDSNQEYAPVGPRSGGVQIQQIFSGNSGMGVRGAVHDPRSNTPYSDGFYQECE